MTVFNAGLPQAASTAGLPIGSTMLLPTAGTILRFGNQEWLRSGLGVSASAYPDAAREPLLKIALMTAHARAVAAQIRAIATDGNGTFVAVDNTSNVVVTTDGGATWTTSSITFNVSGVAWGGGRFMVIGNDAATIYTAWSSNGTSWTTGPTQSAAGNVDSGTIAYGGGRFAGFIGGTLANCAFTSVNGTSLTAVTPGGAVPPVNPQMAWNGSGFLVTTTSGPTFFRSTDGSAWTSFTAPLNRVSNPIPLTAGANGIFVYGSGSGFYRSTDNGVTWVIEPTARSWSSTIGANGLFTGNNQFLMYDSVGGAATYGAGKTVYVSSDFVRWDSFRFDKSFVDTSGAATVIGYDGTRLVTLSDATGYFCSNVNQAAFVGYVEEGQIVGSRPWTVYVRIK